MGADGKHASSHLFAALRHCLIRLCVAALMSGSVRAAEGPVLMTRWAASVSPTNVHSEYPRPQFVRQQWQNLNGLWDYAISVDDRDSPQQFNGQILVPFPVESYLSGVEKRLDEQSTLWYRRHFRVPSSWQGQDVLLHFGAVDWAARVWVNGHLVGSHSGGYDAFTCDLTATLNWDDENELLVAVMDPTEGDQPRGKQSRKPEGIFYTPSSGIWQTVWLEPVPPAHLTEIRLTPEFKAGTLHTVAMANTTEPDVTTEVVVLFEGQEVGRAARSAGEEMIVPLSQVRPWSPNHPQLYDVVITLRRGSTVLDTARSYFGLREIHIGVDNMGMRRLFLNGEPLFQVGVLDQGFWPDGLYTAPSDEAWRSDLETVKRLGFNLVRKHVKVEPERWYYWADKLGLLVWQDMPSGNNATEAGRREFRRELARMIDQKYNHPCIVMWVLFNESWGQFDTERLVRWIKSADPTRLVDNASGWTDAKAGDVIDSHSYTDPIVASPDGARAAVLGEFGGLGLTVDSHTVDSHTWSDKSWAYQDMPDSKNLTSRCCALLDKMWSLQKSAGLAAAVYTQLTDIETECNGFLTYDRALLKMDAERIKRANSHQPLDLSGVMLLPCALQGEYTWHYTTNTPAKGWPQPEFDSSTWLEGKGGFGTSNTPGAILRTEWKTADIWVRREFTLTNSQTAPLSLMIHHDEDAEVYLNGVLGARLEGYTVGYELLPTNPEAGAALHPGRNVIAIHCHQTGGGQYIDAGLVSESSAP